MSKSEKSAWIVAGLFTVIAVMMGIGWVYAEARTRPVGCQVKCPDDWYPTCKCVADSPTVP